MSEMLSPLEWEPTLTEAALTPPPDAGGEKTRREAFCWPTPPLPAYPAPSEQTEPLACEIVGHNGTTIRGRMTFCVPEETVVHVQVPPARTALPLRFEQFRSITITAPLAPLPVQPSDPHAAVLGHRSAQPYRIWLAGDGGELSGETIGHVEAEEGLYLFPPCDEHGSVQRLFLPCSAYRRYEVGPRIGELLVAQQAATPAQVEAAAQMQQQLRQRKIGDILVAQQVVTPQSLFAALDAQATMPLVRIGEALISLGMIDDSQLAAALAEQKRDRNTPLGEVLVRMKVVSAQDLQIALARKMGYPLVDIDHFPWEPEALAKIPYNAAVRLQMMPLVIHDGRLVVALDDPSRRRAAVDEAEFIAQMKVVPVLAQCERLEDTLLTAYEKIGGVQAPRFIVEDPSAPISFELPDMDKLVETLEKEKNEAHALEDERPIEQSDNSLVKLINNMIVEAHQQGVSDIHIEAYPGREKIRVRFRKDGLLSTYLELPANYRAALIARIKVMCDLDISEKRKPQDGKMNFAKFSPQHKLELRVATIPTNNGLEDVVMRILASAKAIPLDRLGLSPRNLGALRRAIERPYGLVLCVGPTGSGKTTTLHSALSHINVPERKIWTAEDPIEITQPGLRQVQVNPKIEWTFAKALRSFLRADPDVIMVGEVRDQETAQTAIEASLTGHLVLSTLHTNSAPETVTRLLDMGMDPFNFADSLLAVLAQRLVRRLCTHCRTARDATDEELDELVDDYRHAWENAEFRPPREMLVREWSERLFRGGRVQTYKCAGCDKCGGSGFRGRAGLHELMVVTRELRRLIQTGSRAEMLQQTAMADGMHTLRQDGIEKVLAGITTIEEVRATSNA